MAQIDQKTKAFYDEFWPKNVPSYEKTKSYMLDTIREREMNHALDAGCGHGVCSVVLAEISDFVTAVDLSDECLATARNISEKFDRTNLSFHHQDLQNLDLADEKFDLVWCWGVAMMAPDPEKVFHHLCRVTKPGGVVYLGLYLKTWLSPIHQFLRHFFRRFFNTPPRKKLVMDFFAWLTSVIERIRGNLPNLRNDNVSIQAQVDDWYYPPFKTFYGIEEIIRMFESNGFTAECIQDRVGRMKSATIFVVRAVKI